MNKVGKFEKVSYEQFHSALQKMGFQDEMIQYAYDLLKLPTRATKGSAGYDFKAPFGFTLHPGQTMKIPTGIRCKIEDGWWLGCYPRSSLGFKYRMQFDNGVPVIDSDYYNSDNEGHIFLKVTNDSKLGDILSVEVGDGFAQGIFLPFGITVDDDATAERNGGMGSTGA